MIPLHVNFLCPQGTTFTESIDYTEDGVAVDLTNYSAKMQIRESYNSKIPTVSLTSSTNGGLILGGSDGTIVIYIAHGVTSTITPKDYVYDLIVTAGEEVDRLIEGLFIITPEVTK